MLETHGIEFRGESRGFAETSLNILLLDYLNEYSGLNRDFAKFVNAWELNSEEKVGDLLKSD